MLNINNEDIKKHKSKREIHLELELFIKSLQIKKLIEPLNYCKNMLK